MMRYDIERIGKVNVELKKQEKMERLYDFHSMEKYPRCNYVKSQEGKVQIYDFGSFSRNSRLKNQNGDARQIHLFQDLEGNEEGEEVKEKRKGRNTYIVLIAALVIIVLIIALINEYTNTLEQQDMHQNATGYISSVAKNDCYLCGNSENNMLFSHWGEQNVGLINLNTFEVFIYELNRYDQNNNLIQENVRFNVRFGYQKWAGDGGSKVSYSYDVNRGYFTGSITIDETTSLQVDKLKSYVCMDCLNGITEQMDYKDFYCDIALVDFNTRRIEVFKTNNIRLQLSDYQIAIYYDNGTFDLNGFYCPIRYSESGLGYSNDSTALGIIKEYCQAYQIPLTIGTELMEFLSGFINIDSIQQSGEVIAFEELSEDGIKTLYVYSDGSYKIAK